MDFRNYDTVSDGVRAQIEAVRRIFQRVLSDDLTGVYVHGSLALNRFREGVSDVDILVVAGRRISRGERLRIAQEILAIDRRPSPLELSAIYMGDLMPWRHPTRCQFHYSGAYADDYAKLLSGEAVNHFLIDGDFEDPDIACHARLTRQFGVHVCGKPVDEVFPEVPEAEFLDSLCGDIDDFDFHAYGPDSFASNILTLGRVLSYLVERRILSKYDAGLWALQVVPQECRSIVENALEARYEGTPMRSCPPEALEELRRFLIWEIRRELYEEHFNQKRH